MADGFKYWAFISYSHQDRAWGDWLHKTLETYRVPKRLVGRASRDGQVPARLFPVFRDRDELPSSANLGDVLNESLRQSRYQIVICSPRSAASRWVNEEIKYFKSLGREDRVLYLIVDGEPNVFDIPGRDIDECFAPALRYRVDAQGQITEQPAEPIAADAREHADGKRGAKIKLLSGLLGVGFDELFQRERQRQFWQRVQMSLAAAAFAGLCVGAWQWFEGQRSAREREIVIERLVENGRTELLAGRHARAAVYLNEVYGRQGASPALGLMLNQALQPVRAWSGKQFIHEGIAVYRSAYSADGRHVVLHVLTKVTGQQQAVVKLYDAVTGSQLAELANAPVMPVHLSFIGDGKRLLVSGFDDDHRSGKSQTVIWNLEGGKEHLRLEGLSGLSGQAVDAHGEWVLISTSSGLNIHRIETGKLVRTLHGGQAVFSASFSPDGESIAYADRDGVVRLASAKSGAVIRTLKEGSGLPIAGFAFTPDGTRLFGLTGRDGNRLLLGDLRIWNLQTGLLHLSFSADPDYLNGLYFDQAGQRFMTVGSEGYKVWSTGRGILLFSIGRSLSTYSSGALHPDGRMVVTADFENNVAEAWDVSSKRLLYTLDLHSDGVSSALFNASANELLLASRDGTATTWQMPVHLDFRLDSVDKAPFSARFSQNGESLLSVGGNMGVGAVSLLDAENGREQTIYAGHDQVVFNADFSPDERRFATASLDGGVFIWKTGDPLKPELKLRHHESGAFRVRFNRAGSRVVTTTNPDFLPEQDSAGLWDVDSGALVARLQHDGLVYDVAFDPSGTLVATAGVDGRVRIWNADSGALAVEVYRRGQPAIAVEFSGDGSRLLAATHGPQIFIADSRTGDLLDSLELADMGLPTVATWDPAEKLVAIGTQSGNISIWEPATNRTRTLKGHLQSVQMLHFHSDGELLLSASRDGSVRAWDVDRMHEIAVPIAFGRAVEAFDVHAKTQRIVATAWGQLVVTTIRSDLRPHTEIARLLNCRVPWSISLDPVSIKPNRLQGRCDSHTRLQK